MLLLTVITPDTVGRTGCPPHTVVAEATATTNRTERENVDVGSQVTRSRTYTITPTLVSWFLGQTYYFHRHPGRLR
jgi:hypothetical protein